MFTITQALLLSIFIKSFLHAVFTLLLCFALYLTFRNRRSGKRQWWGLFAIILMYLIDTAHLCMIFYQDIRDFGDGGAGRIKSAKSFALFGLSQIAMEYVNYAIADLLLLWRTWIIYQRSYVAIAIPTIFFLGTIISSFGWVGSNLAPASKVVGNDLEGLFVQLRATHIRNWHLAAVILSITTNVTLTGMIAFRLIRHHRKMRAQFGFSTLVFESLVIIESGALYALGWVIYVVMFALKHNAEATLLDTLSQLAGIVPTLIIVTVALGISPANPVSETYQQSMSFRVKRGKTETGFTLDDLSVTQGAGNGESTTVLGATSKGSLEEKEI